MDPMQKTAAWNPRVPGGGNSAYALASAIPGAADLRPQDEGSTTMQIKFLVNGTERTVDADPSMPLLWALRDLLGLPGTKYGCGISACGACTVHLDGKAVKSCVVPLSAAAGASVTTIEGLGGDHPVQRAWIEEQVPQCGYCQSGQVMQAAALLAANPDPTREQIREGMNGVLCRCGTYVRIESAVQRAAVLMRKEGDPS